MAQSCTVIQADPWSLAEALAAIPANVVIIEKSTSAGKFIVVTDDSADDQEYTVIVGDPDKLATELNAIITLGKDIIWVAPTFSAAHYLVVHT